MWKQINFEGIAGELGYKIEDGIFHINCFLSSPDFQGAKMYVHSKSDDEHSLCLGSFSADGKGFSLVKSYPLSFFQMNGVEMGEESDVFFSLKSEGKEIYSKADIFQDPALLRARELAENHPVTSETKKLAAEHMAEIRNSLSSLPVVSLPVLPDYTFHVFDNIKHPFGLSAIDHIVHSSEFVSAFVKSGEWYIGEKKDSSIFAVCICSRREDINPMYNASDCDCVFEVGDIIYHTVGIELCDDGQYFCRLENE